MFGVVFPNRSFPMDISAFSQIDTFHWILDMNTFVGEAYDQVRELCIFLLNDFTLPPDKALAVYIQSPGCPFVFCGAVTLTRPSAVLTLAWPEPGGSLTPQLQITGPDAPLMSAKIGVSVEELASLPSLDVTAEKRIERLALKVGESLFNFMQSFCGVDGSKLVVPMDILDRWFKKFQDRAKRDPEYLKGFALIGNKTAQYAEVGLTFSCVCSLFQTPVVTYGLRTNLLNYNIRKAVLFFLWTLPIWHQNRLLAGTGNII
ncbi:hypothetical protein G4B88_005581 [Cannabis sativa]|uniref:Hikeshi-like domain-containing protein n=2 Tax=Cannabis sativa TaxID=3483 RepID=A0A7J6H9A7_CANSA|nr:hypothetical protein G4B88_005581 [Cannabis sativa]